MPVGAGCIAGEDETVGGACHGVVEPFRARLRAEEEEEERERQLLATLQRDRLELAVFSVERSDLAAVAHGDAIALELADQILGHGLAQVGAAVEQRDEGAACRPTGSASDDGGRRSGLTGRD